MCQVLLYRINEISIIIPCHRVVGTNGSLTGYAGGIDKKVKLLELERCDMNEFYVPKKGIALRLVHNKQKQSGKIVKNVH